MKKLLAPIFLLLLCGTVQAGQDELRQAMWKFAGHEQIGVSARDAFEFVAYDAETAALAVRRDEEARMPNHDGYLEDIANGYLYIQDGSPPCGCTTAITIGAYARSDGSHLLLRSGSNGCTFYSSFSASEQLDKILPENFGLETFLKAGRKAEGADFAMFAIKGDIRPSDGEVILNLAFIPVGLRVPSAQKGVLFAYTGREEDWNDDSGTLFEGSYIIYDKNRITAQNEADYARLVDIILRGDFAALTAEDETMLDIDSQPSFLPAQEALPLSPLEGMRAKLLLMQHMHREYLKLAYTSATLGWDAAKGRFFIKKMQKPVTPVTFMEFLRGNYFSHWAAIC